MALGIAITLIGMLLLAHTAPFPFLLDAAAGRWTLWRPAPPAGRKAVYLTFDDGPNPRVTPMLLDLLAEKRVRATFFVIDRHIDAETAPLLRRMFNEGHGVGMHSGDRWLMLRSRDRIVRELQSAADRIQSAAGSRPCPIFRPHAGWRSLSMIRAMSRLGYTLTGWGWMTWDWSWFRRRNAEAVSRQVLAHVKPGKIIVLHDGHHEDPRADRDYAVGAARRIIEDLLSRGYVFETLCSPAGVHPSARRERVEGAGIAPCG